MPFQEFQLEEKSSDFKTNTNEKVNISLKPNAGIPYYFFEIYEGELPVGLSLDSFTGEIKGSTDETGSYKLSIRAQDNDPTTPAIERNITIRVL